MIPVENEGTGETAVWKLNNIGQLSKGVHFTYHELIALYLTKESLKSLESSPLFEVMTDFFRKLEDVLGPKAHEGLAELSKSMTVRPTASWVGGVSRETMDTVHAACTEGHYLEIEYQSAGGESAGRMTKRKVGPTNLYFADSGAYLIAIDTGDQKTKTFAMTRIKHAVMLDEEFDSHGFDPVTFLGASFGVFVGGEPEDIELFIEDPIASYIADRRFHSSQRVVRKEGGVSVFLSVKTNDELARWILGLGPAARVVSPLTLKQKVISLAQAIVDQSKLKSA